LSLLIIRRILFHPFVVLYNVVCKFASVNIPPVCFAFRALGLQLATFTFLRIIALKFISRFIPFATMRKPGIVGCQHFACRTGITIVFGIVHKTRYEEYIRVIRSRLFGRYVSRDSVLLTLPYLFSRVISFIGQYVHLLHSKHCFDSNSHRC